MMEKIEHSERIEHTERIKNFEEFIKDCNFGKYLRNKTGYELSPNHIEKNLGERIK